MNNLKLLVNAKDLRKAGFAVGFGLVMGNFVGKCVVAGISGSTIGVMSSIAGAGNKNLQDFCDTNGIKYKTKENSDEES